MTSAFDKRRHIEGKRQGQRDPYGEIRERVQRWQGGYSSPDIDRIFVISGHPGMGKSWLLRWIEERLKGIYINLEDRRGYATPHEFVNRYSDIVARENPPLCCIDHIPPSGSLDDTLVLFEEKILVPAFDGQDSFLVLAVQKRDNWCWRKLPYPTPLELDGLNQAGTERLLRGLGCRQRERWQEIFWYSSGHPYLTSLLWEAHRQKGEYSSGMTKFLNCWLERTRVQEREEQERLWKVAMPLSLVDDLEDSRHVRAALQAARCREKPLAAVNVLKNARWAEIRRGDQDDRYGTYWVEYIRQCVRHLFERREPERFQQVSRVLENVEV